MRFTSAGIRTKKPEELNVWKKLKVLFSVVTVPRPDSKRSPADLSPDTEVITIKTASGIALNTWYCDRGKETSLVLLFHGYAADKTSLLQEAMAFLALDQSVMLVDFRGSGGSSESYTTIGVREAEDIVAVFRFVRKNLGRKKLVLFGRSMGAAAVLRAVHVYGIQPDAVILEAVFDSMLNTVRNRFHTMGIPSFPSAELLVFWGGRQWGFNGFMHNPVDYVSSLRCLALFMHGTDDPRATISQGRHVFAAVQSPKIFESFKHAGHEPYISTHPVQWRKAVEAFLKS